MKRFFQQLHWLNEKYKFGSEFFVQVRVEKIKQEIQHIQYFVDSTRFQDQLFSLREIREFEKQYERRSEYKLHLLLSDLQLRYQEVNRHLLALHWAKEDTSNLHDEYFSSLQTLESTIRQVKPPLEWI